MKNLSQWDSKFIKEGWTFPFGTLMNAYATMHANQNHVDDIEDFIEISIKLHTLSVQLVKSVYDSFEEQKGPTEPEMPTI
jgi:hypothetical protein